MDLYVVYDHDQPVGEWLGFYRTEQEALAAALASDSGCLEIILSSQLAAELENEQPK